MLSIGGGSGQMVIGSLDGEISFKPLLDQAFQHVKYKLNVLSDIDAWLKSHIIPILMLNAVSFNQERELIKLDGNRKQIQHMIRAMDEGFKVLEAMDITITPEIQAKLIAGSFGEIEALNNANI
ncbi:hypothetical protein J7E78_20640 [Paenibacillus polymyxa]|uniref:hypothetical protein n=1 Tax=Paenibacillus polymyxa TaxID=1406 RepID=UPI001BE98E68|nr:hypothetical protein [Paenibacillus polymyxa]MBT2285957.1 hypothetical protein [Paenibacillus polymyxa]